MNLLSKLDKRLFAPGDSIDTAIDKLFDGSDDKKDDVKDDTKDDLELDIEDDLDDDVIEDDDTKDDDLDEDDDEEVKTKKDDKDDEDEDLVDILSPFNKKKFEIKFPGALKEFPQIERALNTAVKYKEVFPTLNDALEAQSNLERYDEIEKDLAEGSSLGFLNALKEKDGKSFTKVVDNYLTNLKETDEGAYYHVIGNNIKNAVFAMSNSADKMMKSSEEKNQVAGKDLLTAAKILNEFMFGSDEFVEPKKFSKEENVEENKLKTDRENFAKERLDTYQNELSERVEAQISKKIKDHIDPKDQMNSYTKRTAIRDANELVAKYIENDKEFRSILDRLWEKAAKSNFSQESMGNIRRAYVTKGNVYLPKAIKKVRAEALTSGGNSSKRPDVDRKGPIKEGRANNNSTKVSRDNNGKIQIPKGKDPYEVLLG